MADCGCGIEANKIKADNKTTADNRAQRKVLCWLLAINALMFAVENVTGLLANSAALLADSLDMLADAIVYGISLYAVGRSASKKHRAAFLSGIFQITLAGLVLFDVIRRFVFGGEPQALWMVGIGVVALVANLSCFALIAKHQDGEIHLRASWIFSRNDAVANLGVILAGLLVTLFQSRFPDLLIGLGISILVLWGGIAIIREVKKAKKGFT